MQWYKAWPPPFWELEMEDLETSHLISPEYAPQHTPPDLEILMEVLKTADLISPELPPPPRSGGLCVVDWCVDTTAVSPKNTVSLICWVKRYIQ